MKTKIKKYATQALHPEDRAVAIAFIDNVRLRRKEDVQLEIMARYVAKYVGINADQPNAKLANAFAKLFETGQIA